MSKAIQFVRSYSGDNQLEDPAAEASQDVAAILENILEKAAGFEPNPRIRMAIENYAMDLAKKHFGKDGLGYSVEDKSKQESYDLLCTRQQERVFVEVKGTRSAGNSIILTRRELEHVKQHSDSALFVVHSVQVTGSRHPKVSGGSHTLLKPWKLADGVLRPQAFIFTLPDNKKPSTNA